MMTFVKGLLFGMTLQLSIGPVCFAVLHKALRDGVVQALKMVGGVIIADGLYMVAALLGAARLLAYGPVKNMVMVLGAGILLYFGVRHFRPRQRIDPETGQEKEMGSESFIYGIKLTLVNPLTIVFWSGVFGTMVASGQLRDSVSLLVFSTGCLGATFLFLGSVSLLGDKAARFFQQEKILRYLDYGVGMVLIVFGLAMLLNM